MSRKVDEIYVRGIVMQKLLKAFAVVAFLSVAPAFAEGAPTSCAKSTARFLNAQVPAPPSFARTAQSLTKDAAKIYFYPLVLPAQITRELLKAQSGERARIPLALARRGWPLMVAHVVMHGTAASLLIDVNGARAPGTEGDMDDDEASLLVADELRTLTATDFPSADKAAVEAKDFTVYADGTAMDDIVHGWSRISAEKRAEGKPEIVRQAAAVLEFSSLPELVNGLKKIRRERGLIPRLELFAHGMPGGMKINEDLVSSVELRKLDRQGDLFAPGGKILLMSCNVARDSIWSPVGADFMRELGDLLLDRGGSVSGSNRFVRVDFPSGFMEWRRNQYGADGVYRPAGMAKDFIERVRANLPPALYQTEWRGLKNISFDSQAPAETVVIAPRNDSRGGPGGGAQERRTVKAP